MVTTTTGLATSFITFTRTSNATVTDSNGFIEWAGHNLLTNSESFDASAWVKSSATVTANTDPAPNGTTTGDTIAASGANGTALQTWTAEAVPYTFGVWLRRKTGTGNIQIAADSGTYTTVTITSSWALYTVTQTPAAGSKSAGIRIVTSGDEVYAWGAHLYRSDLGGMVLNPARGDAYYPTTPRNLLGFTEDFSNAAWVKTNILAFGSGSISNAIVAPNGLQTADKIVSSTANNNHRVQWSVAGVLVSNTKYVFSFYAKAAEYTKVQIADAVYSVYSARFDLTGSGSVVASSGCTAAITSVGDGWYRCSAIYTSGGANAWAHISPYPDSGATFTVDGASYLGDGISGIYVWGAQLSDSASLDAYSPVYGAAVTSAAYYAPRLDYDPVTLAARGLLVEEQRTNLLQHTQALENAYWTKMTADAATKVASPDGTNSANLLYPTSSTNFVGARYIFAATTYTSGFYTISFYAKAAGKNVVGLVDFNATGIAAWFNLSTGLTTSGVPGYTATMTPAGNGWYRCTMTNTSSHSNSLLLYVWVTINDAAGGNGVTVSGTDGAHIYGMQIEFGTFATSYIPNGSAVAGATRTEDVASVSTQAFPYSSSEGTIVLNATGRGSAPYLYAFAGADNSGTNSLYTYGPTTYTTEAYNGGALQTNFNSGVATGTAIKVAAGYASNNFGVSVNGASVTPDTTYSQPSIDKLRIGSSANITVIGQVYVRQITYIPRRLTNAELVARST